MESQALDNVKFEKEKAVVWFNRFRGLLKFWQFFKVLVVLGLIWWSLARVQAVLDSIRLFNHHVVFLLGNAIIVSLLMLGRRNDDLNVSGGGDFYDEYVKHSEAAYWSEPTRAPPPNEEAGCDYHEKPTVVGEEGRKSISQQDDVAAVIEKARRRIKRFQRTQSEKLKQEIAVRPRSELRRSETRNGRKAPGSWSSDAAEMEALSSEEFRRRIDALIDKHRSQSKENKGKSVRRRDG